jgi:uncharacterized membrane protein (DUF106 family)
MGLIPTYTLTQSQEIIIAVLAVIYAIVSVTIQRKLSNAKRLREIQAHISKVTKEMNQMMKNKVPDAEINAKQKEIMPLLGESMKSSMKPMFVILPMFLVVYYVLIPMIPFGAPATPKSIQSFFFIAVFVSGIVSAIALMIYDKKMTKKEEQLLEKESPAQIKKEIEALETKKPASNK